MCNVSLTKAPEGKRKRGRPNQHGKGLWKRREERRDGGPGKRCGREHRTEKGEKAM